MPFTPLSLSLKYTFSLSLSSFSLSLTHTHTNTLCQNSFSNSFSTTPQPFSKTHTPLGIRSVVECSVFLSLSLSLSHCLNSFLTLSLSLSLSLIVLLLVKKLSSFQINFIRSAGIIHNRQTSKTIFHIQDIRVNSQFFLRHSIFRQKAKHS